MHHGILSCSIRFEIVASTFMQVLAPTGKLSLGYLLYPRSPIVENDMVKQPAHQINGIAR
jgi:hypothetical protein